MYAKIHYTRHQREVHLHPPPPPNLPLTFTFTLMMTGALSQNVSKLFFELKVVTDNLSLY